jgi:hypothetical protein
MSYYETTFEYQRLPLSMELTNDAVDFMKNNDEFVQYYHNYYKEDVHFQPFREMVQKRISLGQIIRNEGLFCFISIRGSPAHVHELRSNERKNWSKVLFERTELLEQFFLNELN